MRSDTARGLVGGPLPPVAALARVARDRPDARTVSGDRGTIDAATLAATAGGLAAALGRGGPVLVVADDAPALAVGLVAALAAGRPALPVDPSLPDDRIVALALRTGAEAVVADRGRAPALGDALPVARILVLGDAAPRPLPDGDHDPAAVALLVPTAGTSGEPTLVPVTHAAVLADAAEVVADGLLRPDDHLGRIRTAAGSLAAAVVGALALGLPIAVLDPRRAPGGRVLRAFAALGVTYVHLTPSLLRLLVRAEPPGPLRGLRLLGGGGEAMRWTDVAAAARVLGSGARVLHGYGATEVGAVTRILLDPHGTIGAGVVPVGRPVPGRQVRIAADLGHPGAHAADPTDAGGAPPVGEVVVTRTDLGARPVRTGDLGRWDDERRLHLVGRADRMLKVGGVRVEPAALEAVLAAQPGVVDAAVVARPDEAVGLRLVAHVVVDGSCPPTSGELQRSLRERGIPGAEGLRFVPQVSPLPLLPSGKPDLLRLAAAVAPPC